MLVARENRGRRGVESVSPPPAAQHVTLRYSATAADATALQRYSATTPHRRSAAALQRHTAAPTHHYAPRTTSLCFELSPISFHLRFKSIIHIREWYSSWW
ncbi:unnamed protein product [Spodoptera exigua]|nr:unnamed protein product [Spodoptera exigua]